MGKAGDFTKLLHEGKIDEARAIVEAEKARAKFAPDEIICEPGCPAVLKHRGELVVHGKDGNWRLRNPPRRTRNRTTKG